MEIRVLRYFLEVAFVYFKKKQRGMAEKDPPFGHVVIFQTWPNTIRVWAALTEKMLINNAAGKAFRVCLMISTRPCR